MVLAILGSSCPFRTRLIVSASSGGTSRGSGLSAQVLRLTLRARSAGGC